MSRHLLLQISDIHLSSREVLPPGVRPLDILLAGLAHIDDAGIRPDLYVLTGDLADAGESSCYEQLAEIFATSPEPGRPVVYLPGNHDERGAFRRHLLGQAGQIGPIDQVRWHGGLRVVALDSTVPGEDFGSLAAESLDFLRAELATPAPDGTVLAVHHPPIPTPIAPMSALRLREPECLAEAIAGSDVRLVICGHNHHGAVGMLGAVPVWVSPAALYRADVTSRAVFRALPGSAFSMIEIDEHGPVVTVVPVPAVLA